MGSNEPVRNECEVIYEMFHIQNCMNLISHPQFYILNISYITSQDRP